MRRLSKMLLRAGLAVWTFGLISAAFGVWVTLPPIAVELLVLGFSLASGAVLVGAGVALADAARREDQAIGRSSELLPNVPRELGDGGWPATVAGVHEQQRGAKLGSDRSR